jgi:hypothetical protein
VWGESPSRSTPSVYARQSTVPSRPARGVGRQVAERTTSVAIRRQHVRYVLYRSYVLLARPPIEPISEHIPDQVPLGKAQRIEELTYESPALPLSYSAVAIKLTERDPERQPRSLEGMTIEQRITSAAHVCPRAGLTAARPGHVAEHLSSRFELSCVVYGLRPYKSGRFWPTNDTKHELLRPVRAPPKGLTCVPAVG